MDRAFSASSFPLVAAVTAHGLRTALVFVVCLVVATAFHEFAHAITAHKLGDRTPESEGRVTLNPMSHADPLGTVAIPLFAGLFGAPLFGWGRPVMTRPQQYTRKLSMRAGMALVSFAGPLSNVLQAVITWGVVAGLIHLGGMSPAAHPQMFGILGVFLFLNLTLAVFNLLPIHPLDGGKILAWALPPKYDYIDDFLTRYGFVILLGLMLAPGVLALLLDPLYHFAETMMGVVDPGWSHMTRLWFPTKN